MSSRVADARVDTFSASWRADWRGPHRFVMLTSSLSDPGRFVAYGTDGHVSFRVEGSWGMDLSRFLARLDEEGVELVPPPQPSLATPPGQPTFPDPLTVQRCLDARVGRSVAA
jgi:hypothetical protein